MSHIVEITIEITDLSALERAAARCGMALQREQQTFRAFEGRSRCDHAIAQVLNPSQRGYEIGVVAHADGGWTLQMDPWDRRLVELAGTDGARLRQAYAAEVAIDQLYREGWAVTEKQLESGAIELECFR